MKKILILMYHMISRDDLEHDSKYAVPLSKFKSQMSYLKAKGFAVISLKLARELMLDGKRGFPAKPVVITFDDGYIDHYENALPVLVEYAFPATCYVVAGYVGKTNQWRIFRDVPERRLVGWREMDEMRKNGVTFGSHTMSHPFLSRIDRAEARREIEDSKKLLEDKGGSSVEDFSYPYGDNNDFVRGIVKDTGYKTACMTVPGFNADKSDLMCLKRIYISGSDTLLKFEAKTAFGINSCNPLVLAKKNLKNALKSLLR